MKKTKPTAAETAAEKIAQQAFGFTLKTQSSDHLDFHEVSVWGLKEALAQAYLAGTAAADGQNRRAERGNP